MSKTTPVADRAADPSPVVQVTLTEFCTRLSEKVRRPELISAFEFVERRAGRVKDAPDAYQARFDAFLKTPV